MTASLGQFAANSGDAVQGIRLVRLARRQLAHVPPLAEVWLNAIEGVALAERRDRDSLRLLSRAETGLGAAQRGEPIWPWLFHFDAPKLASYRAVAATHLGMGTVAEAAYQQATTASQSPKQRAALDVHRATALVAAGQLVEGCQVARQAFDAGRQHDSARVLHLVGRFRAELGTQRHSAIAELDDRLQAVYELES